MLSTDTQGHVNAEHLPFGRYNIQILQPGFAELSRTVQIGSTIPIKLTLQLAVRTVQQSVTVRTNSTLLDPDQLGSVDELGTGMIENRLSSLPGRSLQDLVNSQPGWLYEGNAVLHPRGSEYQTQFVVDGVPMTDNRSPGFGPEIEADDVQSMSIYTAGFPAEYGRKMGGVVEVNTQRDAQPGLHGEVALSGGSFTTAGGFAELQYAWGRNTLGGSANGSRTDHYLNPVVPENYSNTGTAGDFSLQFRRDPTSNDKLIFSVRKETARYDVPNELVQQQAGQRQTSNNLETIGNASWQHIFSADSTVDFHLMARDNASNFVSNTESTPIAIEQHNDLRDTYFKAAFTLSRGHQEWRAGVDSDNTFLHEHLNYSITDPTQFDPGTQPALNFTGSRPDLEQAVFVQDLLRLKNWSVTAGLRWDHYQLLLNRQALQPRVTISRYFPSADMAIHASYDRIFQTPTSQNLLLSSSSAVQSADPGSFLRLPVEPSRGNYYEAGVTKVLFGQVRIGATYFRRNFQNYADDDQLQNTAISFPIAFRKAVLYGAEGKLDLPSWHNFSGFASYSYIVGNVWNPVTGGLFLGADAGAAASQLTGHFPDSQDQRNTLRGRLRYLFNSRLWVAGGAQFDSGLPFEFDGDPTDVLAQYGQQVFNRVNFARGRIDPALMWNASAGAQVYKSDRVTMQMQADGENLNDLVDVVDFGGLFSGNAIGPSRSFSLRLTTTF